MNEELKQPMDPATETEMPAAEQVSAPADASDAAAKTDAPESDAPAAEKPRTASRRRKAEPQPAADEDAAAVSDADAAPAEAAEAPAEPAPEDAPASAETESASESESAPAAEAPAEGAAVNDNAARPARRRTASRQAQRRQASAADDNKNSDYMQGFYNVVSPMDSHTEEVERIRAIIEHNKTVAETNRGEYQTIVAMMTGNDEVREHNNPNKLTAVHIYGLEVIRNGAKKQFGTLPLIFDSDDFTAYSNLGYNESDTASDRLRRQRRYTSHAASSLFQCVPVQFVKPEDGGELAVVCSRAFAMELQQERFFFGKDPIAQVGGHAPAYIMSVDPNRVRVECMGIETHIDRRNLTARKFLTDATTVYRPGMAIDVAIEALDVDRENKKVNEIRLSGVLREQQQGLVKNVAEIDVKGRPRLLAQVVAVGETAYVVRTMQWNLIGIIRKEGVRGGDTLNVNEAVLMEVVDVNVKQNRLVGICYKVSS